MPQFPLQDSSMVPTVEWKDGAVRLLDQSRLPEHVKFLDCRDYLTVADAIRSLKVRGAPAIGVTAAMGVALGAQTVVASDYESFAKAVLVICDHLAATRPTAVNLFWAIERMTRLLASLRTQPIAAIKAALRYLSIQRWEPWRNLVAGTATQCKGSVFLATAPLQNRDHGHNQAGLYEQQQRLSRSGITEG